MSAAGALAVTFAVSAGPVPRAAALRVGAPSVLTVVVFVVLAVAAGWVIRRTPGRLWRWAVPVGVVFATAELMGEGLTHFDSLVHPLLTADLAWSVIHWLAIAWAASLGTALLLAVTDRRPGTPGEAVEPPPASGRRWGPARLVEALRSSDRRRRTGGFLVVTGLIAVAELPYVIFWWPGIVFFDTFRSYSYARGTSPWETYEPVGHSILIDVMQWLGTALGLGDAGGVAIGSLGQLLTGAAAFAFMFTRLAVWGLHRRVWTALLAWVMVLPVFGLLAMQVVKDPPFSTGMLVFLTCVGELAFGPAARRRWVWVTLALSGLFVIGTRNNGIHTLVLAIPLLILVLRPLWKRLLVLLGVLLAGYALYVGPVYWLLNVRPGPPAEAFSVPIQQLARIAKYDNAHLSPSDRRIISSVFDGMAPAALGKHYVPGLADPMKLTAARAWSDHTTTQFLSDWATVVSHHPGTAIEATLANTVGYWSPTGTSYDGFITRSFNDIRGIHLDIPSGKPAAGSAHAVVDSWFPTLDYWSGLQDNGYLAVPLLGLAMSPGPMTWLWLFALLVVVRRRDVRALAVFLPAATLMLTVVAGPVSGGQRYSLVLFMALPLAVGSALLPARLVRRAVPGQGLPVVPSDAGEAGAPTGREVSDGSSAFAPSGGDDGTPSAPSRALS